MKSTEQYYVVIAGQAEFMFWFKAIFLQKTVSDQPDPPTFVTQSPQIGNRTMEEMLTNKMLGEQEKNLLYFFLKSKQLDYAKSQFLSRYFEGFEPDDAIISQFKKAVQPFLFEIF